MTLEPRFKVGDKVKVVDYYLKHLYQTGIDNTTLDTYRNGVIQDTFLYGNTRVYTVTFPHCRVWTEKYLELMSETVNEDDVWE